MPFQIQSVSGPNATDTFTTLKNWVDHAYAVTSQQLLSIIFTKYKFLEHSNAIRLFLLMGQGDFIQSLMNIIAPKLSEQASGIYQSMLDAPLRTAISSSNAQYSEYKERV